LLRIFGGDAIARVMGAMKIDDNVPIESRIISSAIENAQKKVEGLNFDHRRDTVEYDDVMNIQREAIYTIRRRILLSDIEITKTDNKEEFIDNFFVWANERLMHYANQDFTDYFREKSKEYGKDVMFYVLKRVVLDVIDVLWTDHIDAMDNLKFAVKLRRFGQNDPLVEYKREGKMMFEKMLKEVWMTSSDRLARVEIQVEAKQEVKEELQEDLEYISGKFESGVTDEGQEVALEKKQQTITNSGDPYGNVGRNDPCPCGSGKKFKKCHGA
jgi:preprotein translocase subunit SecA